MRINTETTDEGVSPVVGVILMVAITVILSAIIATFVLDLGGTVSQNPSAGVTFDQNPASPDPDSDGVTDYNVAVQVVSVENADHLGYQVTNNSAAGTVADNSGTTSNSNFGSSAGDQVTLTNLEHSDKITVTATLEGKTSVIQTYTVDNE